MILSAPAASKQAIGCWHRTFNRKSWENWQTARAEHFFTIATTWTKVSDKPARPLLFTGIFAAELEARWALSPLEGHTDEQTKIQRASAPRLLRAADGAGPKRDGQ